MLTLQQRVDVLMDKHPYMKRLWDQEVEDTDQETQELMVTVIEDLDAMPLERRKEVIRRAREMLAAPN